jgi:divalent metal cation (Fe/Co/Zn/Cd) transporter
MADVKLAATTDVALTSEQKAREGALVLAALLDGGMVGLLLAGGIGGGSLTCLAEGIRGGLMALIDLVTLFVIRRIHRGALAGFDYGTGKIEQLCSIGIAASLLGGALWMGYAAASMALAGESEASPLGLTLAAVVGSLNLLVNVIAWDGVRRATQGAPSVIMRAQLEARVTKLLSSLLVQGTMTVAALAKDPVVVAIADGVGALMVSFVMIKAGLRLLVEAVPDLLDRSTGHVVAPALQKAASGLPEGFSLVGFRSRGTPRACVIEATVACPDGTDVRTLRGLERWLTAELVDALPGVELSLSVEAVDHQIAVKWPGR